MAFELLTTGHLTDEEKEAIKACVSTYGGNSAIIRHCDENFLGIHVSPADDEKDSDAISVDVYKYSLFVDVHIKQDRALSDYKDAPQLVKEIITAAFEGRRIRNHQD